MIASPPRAVRYFLGLFTVALLAAAPALGWEHWGGARGGTRFSPLAQITPANVGSLIRAWEFRTGDLDSRAPAVMARSKFQATPLFVEDSLIFCSPFNEVIALDPATVSSGGATIPRSAPACVRATVTSAVASPGGSTSRHLRAQHAGHAFS